MKNKIHICNWLLTRRCNLKCAYCAITRNYKNKPSEYPDMNYYYKNEMSTKYIIDGLKKLKIHNPDMFHIFYGGEPFLRSDLANIINFCNSENIHYTIITNNTKEIESLIDDLIVKVDHIQGFTSSIDPEFIIKDCENTDQNIKSFYGLKGLIRLKPFINDIVAEMTVSNNNVQYLYQAVKELSKLGINTDITFLDIAKSPYYDFSNIYDKNLLVQQTQGLKDQLKRIENEKLDAHMSEYLLFKIFDILPSQLDCKFEETIHNITIDSDGSLRLCLRIRGVKSPKSIKLNHGLFTKEMEITPIFEQTIINDKKKYCRLCNWTCIIHSDLVQKNKNRLGDLLHKNKR